MTLSSLTNRPKFFCFVCGFLLSLLMAASVLSVIFATDTALAQQDDELVNVVLDGTSKAASAPEAKREITNSITATVARDQVVALIGDDRYQKNKAAVETKIVKQSAKFIPFVNAEEPTQGPDGVWKMRVEVRLASASLRKMVQAAGLLSDGEGASILPLVAVIDLTHATSARWWAMDQKSDTPVFLSQQSQTLYDKLQIEFMKQGFHLIKPVNTRQSPLPEPYRLEKLNATDEAAIGQYFKAPLILKGSLVLQESPQLPGAVGVLVRLQVAQAGGSRTIAELTRRFLTDPGNFEAVVRTKLASELPDISRDLASQVLDAWQRGTLNANLLRLSVRGDLGPREIANFKSALLKNVREVKDLKERLFEKNQVVFDVDYTGDAKKISERLRSLTLPGFDMKVADGSEKNLVLDVRAQR